MLHLVTGDAREAVTVTPDQMATVRLVLDLSPADLASLRRILEPDRLRALLDLADSQLLFERASAEPRPVRPLPVVRDGRLEHPIACRPRILAARRHEAEPVCTWEVDTCGFRCATCGGWIGDETDRGAFLRACFDRGAESNTDSK